MERSGFALLDEKSGCLVGTIMWGLMVETWLRRVMGLEGCIGLVGWTFE